MATCACGREYDPRARPGRPREHCEVCRPPRDDEATRARGRARRGRPIGYYRNSLCGCERDYLTVPLEDAAFCPHGKPLREPPPAKPAPLREPAGASRMRAVVVAIAVGHGFTIEDLVGFDCEVGLARARHRAIVRLLELDFSVAEVAHYFDRAEETIRVHARDRAA